MSKRNGKLISERVYFKLPEVIKDYSLGKSVISDTVSVKTGEIKDYRDYDDEEDLD